MLSEDMARNPMALVQAVTPPRPPGQVHPTVDGMTPGDPGYRSKIPPPEPMSAVEAALIAEERARQAAVATGDGVPSPAAAGPASAPSTHRLVFSCARRDGALVVGLEMPPDWDVVQTWTMATDSARWVATVARALGVRIKDLSGGELGVDDGQRVLDRRQREVARDPPGPRDLAGYLSNVRWDWSDPARPPVGGPDADGATDVRPLDPDSTVEFLEQARRQYEAELAAREQPGPGEPDGGAPASDAPDSRDDALRRRLGLSPSTAVPWGVRGDAGDPDGPPGGPDPVVDGEAPPQPE